MTALTMIAKPTCPFRWLKYVQVRQQNHSGRAMSVRLRIISEIEKVAQEHNRTLAPLTDDLVLFDSGLDSLCFAVIVARLEDELGVDPFTASEDVDFPVTLRDFVAVYEHAAKSAAT
jgi:acyl carrier protein